MRPTFRCVQTWLVEKPAVGGEERCQPCAALMALLELQLHPARLRMALERAAQLKGKVNRKTCRRKALER